MKKPNIALELPIGNVSLETELGMYYQDFTQAIHHFDERYFGDFDENGVPLFGFGDQAIYNQVYIIQYGLICHDLALKGINVEESENRMKICVQWLEKHEETAPNNSIVWRNDFDYDRYQLKKGWISSMYQGQAISLYLRYGQYFKLEDYYIDKANRIFNFFQVEFSNGGVSRKDAIGNFWLEEYPSPKPSFVLNGYIYSLFGIIDLYRVSKREETKEMMDASLQTLRNSLQLYDSGYWSIYDQLHKELASKYYHKNIHIPLMKIIYSLTKEPIFDHYAKRWENQLNSPFRYLFVKIMYRVRPRLKKLLKK